MKVFKRQPPGFLLLAMCNQRIQAIFAPANLQPYGHPAMHMCCQCPFTPCTAGMRYLYTRAYADSPFFVFMFSRQAGMAYAFCTSCFQISENIKKQPIQILYPFDSGKPVSSQNRLSSSPMLSDSLAYTALLLP